MPSAVIEALSEDESCLYAILTDPSGVDLAEFAWHDPSREDGCFRAFHYQVSWWRNRDKKQIEMSARAVGKTISIMVRMFAFPFCFPGREALITAPELVHLEPIVDLVETRFYNQRLGREVISSPATHRPFLLKFKNQARILGRIPQRDGKGVKGCCGENELIFTQRGLIKASEVTVDDLVWSHENRWSQVLYSQSYNDDCVRLEGQGSRPTITTVDHRFYARFNEARNPVKQRRKLGMHRWVDVTEATGNPGVVYWTGTADFPVACAVPIPTFKASNGNTRTDFDLDSSSFWWVVGRFLADGFTNLQNEGRRGRVQFAVHPLDQHELLGHLKFLNFEPHIKERSCSSADIVSISSTALAHWLNDNFGKLATGKRLHTCVYFLRQELRQALLDGYMSGDGAHDSKRPRESSSSASSELSLGFGILGQTLGYTAGYGVVHVADYVKQINGVVLKNTPRDAYRLRLGSPGHGHGVFEGGYVSHRLRSVTPVGTQSVVNIVSVDGSYLANGIFHHNSHPLVLEHEEASDYPEQGWDELIETLKRGEVNASYHAHGVTIGVGNAFHRNSEHALGEPPLRPVSHVKDGHFTVHRIPAMAHPDWSDEERISKKLQYSDESEYRRNVLGLPGDAMSPIFRMVQLMRSTEDNIAMPFNEEIYWKRDIRDTDVNSTQRDITDVLGLPPTVHQGYKTCWAGMDVGLVGDPTEILIAREYKLSPDERKEMKARSKALPLEHETRLQIIARISLKKIGEPAQADLIMWICENYPIKRFSFDATGIGLPIFQIIQYAASDSDPYTQRRAQRALDVIKGYGFSENILVDFDERYEVDSDRIDEKIKKQGIEHNVKEYCVDEETEALTKNGWKRHTDLVLGEEILTLNPESQVAEWQPLQAIHRFNGERLMASLESRSFSSLTTFDHRWFVERSDRGRYVSEWHTTQDLGSRCRIRRAASQQDYPNPTLSTDMVELLAWVYTEGWWGQGRYGKDGKRKWTNLSIGQSSVANPIKTDMIRTLLKRMYGSSGAAQDGYLWREENMTDGFVRFHIRSQVAKEIRKYFIDVTEKVLDPSVLTGMSKEQLHLFIETSILGDGCKSRPQGRSAVRSGQRIQFTQMSEERTRIFELACTLAGIPTSTTHDSVGRVTCSVLQRPWTTPLTNKKLMPIVHRGIVWCPQTITGTWLARRHGTIYFTGNSTDMARLYVEQDRMWFPWDIDMIKQFQASKSRFVRDAVDRYGRRKRAFTQGDDHILDALRMLVLGYKQLNIDTFVSADHQTDVGEYFLSTEDFEWGWQDSVANW